VDGKGYFYPGELFDPYVVLGGGLYFIGDEYAVTKTGGGFDVGLGFDLYLLPWFSLGVNAQYRGMYFGKFGVEWGAVAGSEVQEGFVHAVSAMATLALHTFY
jgi:hypothetical protein